MKNQIEVVPTVVSDVENGKPKMGTEEEVVTSDSTMLAFLKGEAVMADLYGLNREELYEIAQQGELFLSTGKVARAQKVFEALTALEPHVGEFHSALAIVYQKQGRLEDARLEYDRAVALNNRDSTALVNRAELLIELQDIDAAVNDLDALQRYESNQNSIQFKKGRALAQALSTLLLAAKDKSNVSV